MAKKREVWDAVDENGELLGFDLYRDEWGKKPIPEGAHHRVVEIFTVTKQGEVLCTQRDPKKRIFALGGDRRLRCKRRKTACRRGAGA